MPIRIRYDALVACALALVMTVAWAWSDWADLSILHLPDTDDVVRLQQVRDWLGGQRWSDLTQHRLGPAAGLFSGPSSGPPPGLPMHWSRLADLGPAAIIAALTPWMGVVRAELAAILVWPGLLFALALLLIARIARRLGGAETATIAIVVAAIAYPATSVFLPGRIDHHNLQIVLLLAAILGVLARTPAALGRGGACAGASLIVGLEMLPILAALGVMPLWRWCADGRGRPLAAFGLGAAATLVAGRMLFASDAFAFPACDGFTASAFGAALPLALALPVVALAGSWCPTRPRRVIAAAMIVGPAAMLALLRAPQCLSPYGAVDPRLATLWLAHVEEAQSVFAAAPMTSIGYCGLALTGLVATLWHAWRRRSADWATLAVLLTIALAVGMTQLRGAGAAAILAAPGLAALIAGARAHGGARLIAAWVASAGILYPVAAHAWGRRPVAPAAPTDAARGDCASPAAMTALARLAPGTVMAPIDAGAWALAATRHRVIAAPYHRNATGNLAAYRFYAAGPARAAAIAAAAGVDYVMACAGLPAAADPRSAAAALAGGRGIPGFVRRIDATDGTAIYARERLSGTATTP